MFGKWKRKPQGIFARNQFSVAHFLLIAFFLCRQDLDWINMNTQFSLLLVLVLRWTRQLFLSSYPFLTSFVFLKILLGLLVFSILQAPVRIVQLSLITCFFPDLVLL
jgi:hypothetical protein